MFLRKFFSLPMMTVVMLAFLAAAMAGYQLWRENRYSPHIKAASARYGQDPLLIKAIIKRESNFRPNSRGMKGEIGLMQVTPTVGREYARVFGWKDFSQEMLFDPAINTEVGCWYLARAMRRYGDFADPVPFALAHYNAGASNVDRWLGMTRRRGDAREFMTSVTYPGTRRYVRYVMRRWRLYRFFSL